MSSPIRVWKNNKGQYHRVDGSAVEIGGENGRQEWWLNGKRHRTDGPAVVYNNTSNVSVKQEYWLNGLRHREDGPAIEYNNELREWWFYKGSIHRLDGPAYRTNNTCSYSIYGDLLTQERFEKITGIWKKYKNKLRSRLRKKYETELIKTGVCNEVNLYKIIAGYVI